MLTFLILPQLALGVSLQRTSRSATVPQGWVPNACTLIICASDKGDPRRDMGIPGTQDLSGPSEPLAISAPPNRDTGGTGTRGKIHFPELELLKAEMKELQKEMEVFKATLTKTQKVLLIPNGVIVGEKIFKTDGSRGDFHAANASCTRMDGNLALPRDAAENSALQQIVAWHNRRAVLGISYMTTQRKFVDLNGDSIGFFSWAPGEPNNVGYEKCVEMHPDGKWHDRICELDWLIICEF